jgi:hypothetical protein
MADNKKLPMSDAAFDAMLDDILNLSDAEIASEVAEDGLDLKEEGARGREIYRRAAENARKSKLHEAQAAVAMSRNNSNVVEFSSDEITKKYVRALSTGTLSNLPVVLAARNGGEMSEADKEKIARDLIELGIELPDSE